MSDIGLENIQLQPKAFYQNLTEAVQACIDSLPPNEQLPIEDRVHQITFDLTGSRPLKDLSDLIENQFGYVMEPIAIDTALVINASMAVTIQLPAPATRGAFSAYVSFQKTLTDLAGHIETASGKVLGSAFNPHVHATISGVLFVLSEYYPDLGIGAAEIAGVILHELGHCYDYINVFKQGAVVTGLADELSRYTPTPIEVSDVTRAAADCEKALLALKGPKRPELVAFTKQLSDVKTTLLNQNNPSQDSLQAVLHYITSVTAYSIASLQVRQLCSLGLRLPAIYVTDEFRTRDERMADAFSARYGAGSALVRFLSGASYFNKKYGKIDGSLAEATVRYRGLQYTMAPWQILMNGLNITPMVSLGGYDNELKRMTEICSALYAGFKNPKLDGATRDYYLGEIDLIKKQIAAWNAYPDNKIRKYFYASVGILIRSGMAAFHLFTEDLEQQYEKLQLLTKDFVDNPLFYQGARLTKLAESRA